MQITFAAEIALVTGFTVSFADTKDKEHKNWLILPKMLGQPYIPASTMRGRWRHTAVKMIIDMLEQHQQPKLSLATANWLAIGGIRQSKTDGDETPAADIVKQRPLCLNHPWSFWGFSDPVFIESRMQVEHAQSSHRIEPTIIPGQRSDPIQRGEFEPEQVSDPDSFEEWYNKLARRKVNKKNAEKKKADKKAGRVEESGEERTEETADTAVIVPANMPFSRQIIAGGEKFASYLDINRATEVQMGMFVATLREFAKRPVFGAQAGMNLGLVDLSLQANGHHISINGRERSFKASKSLLDLEKQFRDVFPSLDFSIPSIKK